MILRCYVNKGEPLIASNLHPPCRLNSVTLTTTWSPLRARPRRKNRPPRRRRRPALHRRRRRRSGAERRRRRCPMDGFGRNPNPRRERISVSWIALFWFTYYAVFTIVIHLYHLLLLKIYGGNVSEPVPTNYKHTPFLKDGPRYYYANILTGSSVIRKDRCSRQSQLRLSIAGSWLSVVVSDVWPFDLCIFGISDSRMLQTSWGLYLVCLCDVISFSKPVCMRM